MMSFFLVLFSLLTCFFFFNFSSFLNSLLFLESLSLLIFFFSFYLMCNCFSLKFLLYYFVFIVSESAIGLSILVNCLKTYGCSSFRSMNLKKF